MLSRVFFSGLFLICVATFKIAAADHISEITGGDLSRSWRVGIGVSHDAGYFSGHVVFFVEGYDSRENKKWLHAVSFGEVHGSCIPGLYGFSGLTDKLGEFFSSPQSASISFWDLESAVRKFKPSTGSSGESSPAKYRLVGSWEVEADAVKPIQDLYMYHKRQIIRGYSPTQYYSAYFKRLVEEASKEKKTRGDHFTTQIKVSAHRVKGTGAVLISLVDQHRGDISKYYKISKIIPTLNVEVIGIDDYLTALGSTAEGDVTNLLELGGLCKKGEDIKIDNRRARNFMDWIEKEDMRILTDEWLLEGGRKARIEGLVDTMKTPLYHLSGRGGSSVYNCATYANFLLEMALRHKYIVPDFTAAWLKTPSALEEKLRGVRRIR